MNKLSTRTKFAYGVGQIGEQIKVSGFDVFVFFYFQQVLGLSGGLAGTAVAIALVFDAVTDPLAGALSDHWQSPRGRRHPFMYAAALPLAVFWFCLFFPPAGIGQAGLFAWLTVFAILVRGAMTLYHVPHMAMGAELTTDYEERTSVVAWRVVFGVMGAVLTSAVALSLFFPRSEQYHNGLLNPAGYPKVALFGAVIMAVTILYSAWGTRDQIPRLPKAPPEEPGPAMSRAVRRVLQGYRDAFRIRAFRSVFGGAACFMIAYGITQTLQTHLNVFFWELSAKQQALLRLVFLPGFLVGITSTRRLHARFDKRPTVIAGMLGLTITLHLPIVLRLMSLMPPNGHPTLVPLLSVLVLVGTACAGIAITSASSMMADVTQQFELESGRPQEGVLFSAISLSQKLGSGAGHIVAGVGIDLIEFPVQATDPSAVASQLVAQLGLLYLTAATVAVLGLYAYKGYDVSRARYQSTLQALAERKRPGPES